MTRQQAFDNLSTHPWLGRVYSKLSDIELLIVSDFIKFHDHLDPDSFQLAVNRMFVDVRQGRPKHWAIIEELLSCANSSLRK